MWSTGPLVFTLLATLFVAGCMSTESPTGAEENVREQLVTQEALLPNTAPGLKGKGPLIPGTPGLRVTSGYFSRVRMGAVDLFLAHSMASFLRGRDQAFLRLEAHGDRVGPSQTVLHALIPVAVAEDEDLKALAGLTLEVDALTSAKANIRVATPDTRHNRLVELQRVTFSTVNTELVAGTLEGATKRGSRATSSLPFKLGFIAYRGPDMGLKGVSVDVESEGK